MSKVLLPSLSIENHIDTATGEIKLPKYVEGNPRQYRFDASKGVLNMNGLDTLTKPGDHFRLIPVAIRIFNGELFEMGRKDWVEIAFLNCKNQICTVMLHGFSVENLQKESSELFYEDLDVLECIMTVKPTEKTSKESGNKFYICDFSFEAADKKLAAAMKMAVEGTPIYRLDTLKSGQKQIVLNNWLIPMYSAAAAAPTAELPEVTPEAAPVTATETPELPSGEPEKEKAKRGRRKKEE